MDVHAHLSASVAIARITKVIQWEKNYFRPFSKRNNSNLAHKALFFVVVKNLTVDWGTVNAIKQEKNALKNVAVMIVKMEKLTITSLILTSVTRILPLKSQSYRHHKL
jgi:hypothetical protein